MSPLRGEHPDKPTYRILEPLGDRRGDDVYLAHHEIFGERCVQKTVSMHGLEDALASSEPEFLNRLDHPRIVVVREAQWDPVGDRAITFVMRHFEGGSVHDALLEDYRFSLGQAITLTVDALDALGYLHREFGALHRDTKPGNIFLDGAREHGFLGDFGSAAKMDSDGTAAGVLGTTIYRPPETRISERVGADADVFGVGMALLEMLSGRIAWEELDLARVEARLAKGQRAIPDSQIRFAPHVPERLRRCVRKAINANPSARFDGPASMITALRKVSAIDWTHAEGADLEGMWTGTWPPHVHGRRQTRYRVTSRILEAGRDRGRRRLESDFCKPTGGWRQAAPDRTIDPDDRSGASEYFAAVEANAAHRSPAR